MGSVSQNTYALPQSHQDVSNADEQHEEAVH
jgi:hypothetical protein